MTDNFEFDDVKKVRKSLLIVSVAGIFLKQLIKYSTGEIKFLGFSIPVGEATFLSNMIGFIIIFYIIALAIRFSSEQFPKYYKKKLEFYDIQAMFKEAGTFAKYTDGKKTFDKNIKWVEVLIKYSTTFLDIIFPLLLGIISLFIIFFK
jgi:hypothetical protein